jgi:hypothetical protein
MATRRAFLGLILGSSSFFKDELPATIEPNLAA